MPFEALLASESEIVPVGATAQALLHEVDHAPRLPCRAGDHFDVTVEVEQDESPTLPRWRPPGDRWGPRSGAPPWW